MKFKTKKILTLLKFDIISQHYSKRSAEAQHYAR
ncbi:hypothetical protein SAG0194_00190 [Streptococcus agalactiae str. Gottschalk 1003A]|nr:hypothetical protein SAG0194_00190 [Streptococcus agalactiae str. Gottschalk 1003A]